MRYYVTIGDRTVEVDLTGPVPLVDGVELRVELVTVTSMGLRHLLADGESIPMVTRRSGTRGTWDLTMGAHRLSAEVVDERTRAIREMTGGEKAPADRAITAPMPGMVVKVEVEVGQPVKAGQGVVIVEAMKMENELKAPADGVVKQISVEAGQTVEKGALLLTLE